MHNYSMVIDGTFTKPHAAHYFEAADPYTGEVFAQIPDGDPSDADRAISAAVEATAGWRNCTGYERSRLIRKLGELLLRDADLIGTVESQDNGKLLRETRGQARFAARAYEFFAGLADQLTGSTIPLDDSLLFDYTVREPVGVAALITAWNSPMQLLSNKLAPALAAGCTVVVKPSELASASTLEFAKLIVEAGFPPGVVNVISGGGELGRAIVEDRRISKISFTGSVSTGRAIARAAAQNLTPVTLELGGKSPNIIFADANLDNALKGAMAGIFGASGQSCIAGSRLLVEGSVYERVVEVLGNSADRIRLGDPAHGDTQMGPMANVAQYERVSRVIESGIHDGAIEATTRGRDLTAHGSALFVEPVVFRDVHAEMTIAREEIFGPVLSVMRFANEDEAIQLANATDFGLAAGVWTQNLSRAHRIAREINVGTVWINTYRNSAVQAPFGGRGLSGYGRERGQAALDEYLVLKNVTINLNDVVPDQFDTGSFDHVTGEG
jgi:(Z)-2-((N-methylformamido)methylene)-5-hydroxybutyrolactone dehydrogenase